MKIRFAGAVLAVLLMPSAQLEALTPPSASDGPVRLMGCVVSRGTLEAQVDNQTDDALFCDIRCDYELGGKVFSHEFNVQIPKRFQGRVGSFDVSSARPGTYHGEVGRCSKA